MSKIRSSYQWIDLVAAGLLAFALVGCSGGGSGGGAGPAVTPPSGGGEAASAAALNINITGVAINSPPVVTFTITNQAGIGVANLAAADLRFNIAKLAPGSNGAPSAWQNYINTAANGGVQGSQESAAAGSAFGTLVNQGNGTYTYTFATDIRNPAANPCPAPCTDAWGRPLDISYQPGLTHRVTIQQANSAYPSASGVYDFVPAGGAVTTTRDIVATAACNQCHGEVMMFGTNRVDTKLCVTCHNPGSWIAGTPNISLDLKVQSHRMHIGANLPSVKAGGTNKIARRDFTRTNFVQDVRNCTKCHDGTPGAANFTAQGDNWKMQASMETCGACHDDVYFGAKPDPNNPYQKRAHPGGVMSDNSTCALCHAAGRYTDKKDIVVAHNFPARLKAATARFKYNIISVTPTTAGGKPVITFSVTDPTNADKPYDIKTAAPFTAGANSTLTVKLGWNTSDFGNDASGQSFGQPASINLLNNPAVVAGITAGTYTVTSTIAVPATQTGTLRVMMEGHPAGDVTTAGSFADRLAVKSVFKDYAITGSVVARRVVVDIAKCNVCHDVLSLHDNNRSDEPGVCAVCHNPNATDASRRPATAAGVLTGGTDGKLEESIDFKTMIHGMHAGQASKGGFRTKGITVYGFGGSVNDFSNIVFPGKLNDCTACHAGTSYQLTGVWDAPTANGILGSTISTGASASDPSDNLRITPIAAVCSSCHDSSLVRAHMQDSFYAANLSATQATINAATPETCSFCHGAGKAFDVKVVHGVK
jgi:OmcA/MtrC family decaheme c-type cytochrome